MALTQVSPGMLASDSQYTGFKNRIINGAMTINQRGSSITSNGYSLDRYLITAVSGSKMTVQQSSDAPTGFSNSLLITSSAATTIGSTDYYDIGQRIEGFNTYDLMFGTANAKTITISFWVKSSLTGTFGASLQNSAQNRSYPFTFTISTASTWTQISTTIAGDTSGTWVGATAGTGMQLLFNLGTGSSTLGTAGAWTAGYIFPTGEVNILATNGATLQITGLQLEKGSTATSFDYRPYGTELQLCQRYYFRAVTGDSQAISMGGYFTSSDMRTVTYFPVPMRIAPSVVSATGTDYFRIQRNGGDDTFTTFLDGGPKTPTTIMIFNNLDMSGTAGQSGFVYSNNSSASLAFSAEL